MLPSNPSSLRTVLRWTICLPLVGCSVFLGVIAAMLAVAVSTGAAPHALMALGVATGLVIVTTLLVRASLNILNRQRLSGLGKLSLAATPVLLVLTVFGPALSS